MLLGFRRLGTGTPAGQLAGREQRESLRIPGEIQYEAFALPDARAGLQSDRDEILIQGSRLRPMGQRQELDLRIGEVTCEDATVDENLDMTGAEGLEHPLPLGPGRSGDDPVAWDAGGPEACDQGLHVRLVLGEDHRLLPRGLLDVAVDRLAIELAAADIT